MINKYWKLSLITLALIAVVLVQRFAFGSYNISVDVISDLIVFLSIMFGFCATSLAIFSTSKYMGALYKVQDISNNSRTLLHTLIGKYKLGLNCSLISVLYFLFLEVFALNFGTTQSVSLLNPLSLGIFPLVVLNFYFGFTLMSTLTKVVIKEGMLNS